MNDNINSLIEKLNHFYQQIINQKSEQFDQQYLEIDKIISQEENNFIPNKKQLSKLYTNSKQQLATEIIYKQIYTYACKTLNFCAKQYYNSTAIISDKNYDNLYDISIVIESKYNHFINNNSPSVLVGWQPKSTVKKITHIFPMLSLKKTTKVISDTNNTKAKTTYTIKDFIVSIRNFLQIPMDDNLEFMLEPKIDGISCSIIYKNGQLKYIATRGNGKIGENITKNAQVLIDNNYIPKILPINHPPKLLDIRGEIYITKKDFLKINNSIDNNRKFSTARNAVSGFLLHINDTMAKNMPLKLLCYSYYSNDKFMQDTQAKCLEQLCKLGFPINELNQIVAINTNQGDEDMNNILNYCNNLAKKREKIAYETDGIVIKINSLQQQNRLGNTIQAPRWAIAYKFKSNSVITQLLDIKIQISRLGVLTPIAVLQPINIDGVQISRATLHNYDFIKQLDIRIGDTVAIQRSGDVIPQVISVITNIKNRNKNIFTFPDHCPFCNNKITYNSPYYICHNKYNCTEQIIERLYYFASVLEIDDLGKQKIKFFYDNKFVNTICDIIKLADLNLFEQKQLQQYDGWNDKSITNLIDNINKIKNNISLDKVITAIGTPSARKLTSKSLAKHYKDLNSLISSMQNAKQEFTDLCQYSQRCKDLVNLINTNKKIISSGSGSIINFNLLQNKVENLLSLSKEATQEHKQLLSLLKIVKEAQQYQNNKQEYFNLISIENISEINAVKLFQFFSQDYVKQDLYELDKLIKINPYKEIVKINNTELFDKNIVITGKFNNFSRSEIIEKCKKLSVQNISNSILKKTDIIIIGDKPTQKKLQQAKDTNITIYNEAKLLEIFTKYL